MVLTQCSLQMSNTFKNNNLNKLKPQNFDWNSIQIEMKNKLGNDIYESWLKKINLVEEFNNYLLLSVPTRFIRDWITSRYLDQILQVIKNHNKNIIRIEFKIIDEKNLDTKTNFDKENFHLIKIRILLLDFRVAIAYIC